MLPVIAAVTATALLCLWLYRRKSTTESDLGIIQGFSGSPFWGNYLNLDEVLDSRAFGKVFTYHGLLAGTKLCVGDLTAAMYILSHGDDFDRPGHFGRYLRNVFGNGIIVCAGQDHKRQRRILNPVFTASRVKSFGPIMLEKAELACKLILNHLQATEKGSAHMELSSWMSRAGFDTLAQSAFRIHANALGDTANEPFYLGLRSFTKLWDAATASPSHLLLLRFPKIQFLPLPGSQIVRDVAKAYNVAAALTKDHLHAASATNGAQETDGKDLMSTLIRSYFSPDPATRMSEEEIQSQIMTFGGAGLTFKTSTTSWILYELAANPKLQRKLQGEIQCAPEHPTMEDLSSLPYLDWVVRETLRLRPAVRQIEREVLRDVVVPLSTPIVNKMGQRMEQISLHKGEKMSIDIYAINTLPEIWGDDATTFRPERWASPPQAASAVGSIYSNLLTFGAGTRNCIGYHWALHAMRTLIFTTFKTFDLEVDASLDVRPKLSRPWDSRPMVRNADGSYSELEIKVSPHAMSCEGR